MSKKVSDLFTPLVASDRTHIAFERLRTSTIHWAARNLMNDLYRRMGDPNGNFIKDFQTDGFHSRMFEIACYAYLEAQGLEINRRFPSPDFFVSRNGQRVAIEAVTANPSSGRNTDIAVLNIEQHSPQEVIDKCNNEFPIRMNNILRSKLNMQYWELPHCKDIPLVFVVGPFHEPGSAAYIDASLARYLYGVQKFENWTEYNGLLVRGEIPVRNHQFEGKSIRSDFFTQALTENVSAIIYCNQFTVPRFYRLAIQTGSGPANVTDVRSGYFLLPGKEAKPSEYNYVVGSPNSPHETWWQGVTIFHNPRANKPLPADFFACTSVYRYDEERLERTVSDFHTLTSFMNGTVHSGGAAGAPSQGEFDEARTRARTTIQNTWKDVAQGHTLGWGGPIEAIERNFPFIGPSLTNIRSTISRHLPVLFYQSRDSPPTETIIAIPYRDQTGDPYTCRLISPMNMEQSKFKIYGEFSAALWFALAQGMLPPTQSGRALEDALVKWTGRKLLVL